MLRMVGQTDAPTRILALAGSAALTACGGLVVLVAADVLPPVPLLNGRPLALTPVGALAIALVLTGSWTAARARPVAAVGVTLTGLGWLLPALAPWPFLPAVARAWLLAALPLSVIGCAVLPVHRWRHPAGRVLLLLTAGLASASTVVHTMAYDPFSDPDCRWTCLQAPAPLDSGLSTQPALTASTLLLVAAAACGMAAVACAVAPWELSAAAVLALLLLTWSAVVSAGGWNGAPSALGTDTAAGIAAAGVGAAAAIAAARTMQVRRAVERVVSGLSHPSRGVAEPGLVTGLQFAAPGIGWVDPDGMPVQTEPDRFVLLPNVAGDATRLLTNHRTEPDDVLRSLGPAALLGIENARLAALGRARITELQAARRRIISAADAERKMVERDLHDGAQQRLVSVAFLLSPSATMTGRSAEMSRASETHVRSALSALRALAHGIVDVDLDAGNLGPALRALAGSAPLPVDVALAPTGGAMTGDAARAVYRAAAGALDDLASVRDAREASVTVGREGADLLLVVTDDGHPRNQAGPRLMHATDWVEAAGGRVHVEPGCGGGSVVTVRLPCAS